MRSFDFENEDLPFNGNLRINGIFSGKIIVSGTLTIDSDARFSGEADANDLFVFGHMIGTANVNKSVTFFNSALFCGTVTAAEAVIHQGSIVTGNRNIARIIEINEIKGSINDMINIEGSAPLNDTIKNSLFRL